jgi:two-component system, NtrC family, nitrogen regulation sensor histidine kinase GlnL
VTQYGYAILGLTAVVAVLVALIVFALLRFVSAARDTKRHLGAGGSETILLSAALQDAVSKLKAQGQAMSDRAHASEQLSSEIVESLTAGLLLVDRTGRVEILNPAGRRMLGIPTESTDLDYRTLLAATPPLVDALAECLATARPIVRRTLHVPGAARASHLGVTVSPLGGAGGPHGVICLFSDLTTVRELEEQLRLKETLARLGELTAGIAHEFRNGLATIHGYSRLIDPQGLPANYRPYLEGIRQETDLLGKVVTNFLNFARPEKIVFTRVELRGIVQRAIDDLRHEFASGVSLLMDGEFGDILGDEVLLRQVFANLIRNAVEACESVGTAPVVALTGVVDPEQHACRVIVADNGPGIPASAREQIFQPFFTTRSRGTGLGLAIVQKVVVIHNGRVSVHENPGGGAAFQLTFPLADADADRTLDG